MDVLDLAGGTGHPSLAVAEALPNARITLTGAGTCTCERSVAHGSSKCFRMTARAGLQSTSVCCWDEAGCGPSLQHW